MQTRNLNIVEYLKIENVAKIGIILALFVPFLFIPLFRAFSALVLLFFINIIFSYLTLTFRRLSFGIELTTFFTVAAAFSFGPLWGAVFGLFMILAEYIGTMRVSFLAIVTIPAVIIMGFVAPAFLGLGIVTAGLILSIGYNIITFSACFAIRQRAIGLIIFAVTNIIWNKFVFGLGAFVY